MGRVPMSGSSATFMLSIWFLYSKEYLLDRAHFMNFEFLFRIYTSWHWRSSLPSLHHRQQWRHVCLDSMLTLLFGIAPEDSCAVWFCQLEDKVWFEETCPAVSHIWSLTRSPLISIVRILKSTPADIWGWKFIENSADIWGWKYTWLGYQKEI